MSNIQIDEIIGNIAHAMTDEDLRAATTEIQQRSQRYSVVGNDRLNMIAYEDQI